MNGQPPAARRRGRPKAGNAVDASAILDAALQAFARSGFDGVAVRTLNAELGVSHSLINQRFGSKLELWRAAVDHGFGRLVGRMEGVFDPTISDPLEQLRLAVRTFVMFSADHPELLALMDIEARQDTDRLSYIYDTYIAPMHGGVGRLLEYLIAEGRIRRIPLRTFHFLIAHGAVAPFTLVPLAEHFDARSPLKPRAVREHAELIADVIIAGLRIDAPQGAPLDTALADPTGVIDRVRGAAQGSVTPDARRTALTPRAVNERRSVHAERPVALAAEELADELVARTEHLRSWP